MNGTALQRTIRMVAMLSLVFVWELCSVVSPALVFNDPNDQRVAVFMDNGDLLLRGTLAASAGTISAPPGGKKAFQIKSGSTILLQLALEDFGGGGLNKGYMKITGTATVATSLSASSFFDLKDAGGTRFATLDSTGNLKLLGTSGQTLSDKLHSGLTSFPLYSASIITSPFTYSPDEMKYVYNIGTVNNDGIGVSLAPFDPTNGSSYFGRNNTAAGDGDLWVLSWASSDASGRPQLYGAAGDGYGLTFDDYITNGTHVFDTLEYPVNGITPDFTVSQFKCLPGNLANMKFDPTGGGLTVGVGKTLSRFPESANAVNLTTPISYINTHTHRIPTDLKPTGVLYLHNTMYMALNGHDDDGNPATSIQAVGASERAYIFSSTAGSSALGEDWVPVTTSSGNLPALDVSSPVWTNYKFTTPVFVQFGMAMIDYPLAFPTDTDTYAYAVSQHHSWWDRSDLYLGRVKVKSGSTWTDSNIASSGQWEYWTGIDLSGAPLWDSDVTKAVAILHAYGEISQPSIIYHKPSNRYLMTTFDNSNRFTFDGWNDPTDPWSVSSLDNNPRGGKIDPRWIIWEAEKPWGPWRKIFTNDYHGRQVDHTVHSITYYGFPGYISQIIPAWTQNASDGGFQVWFLIAGFWNPFYFVTDHGINDPDYFHKETWNTYTQEYVQVKLEPATPPLDALYSPMAGYEQNNVERHDSALVGYHFRVPRSLTVTQLGRYYATGNSQTHNVKIQRINSDGTVYSPAFSVSVNVDMTALSQMDKHGFIYQALDSSATLVTGADYVLVSDESGGDAWFGGESHYRAYVSGSPVYSPIHDWAEIRSGFTLDLQHSAKWDAANSKYTLDNTGPGNSLGLVNFLFSTAPLELAAAWSVGSTPTRQATGLFGMKLDIKKPIVLTALGRYREASNAQKHEVCLISAQADANFNYAYHEPTNKTCAWAIVDASQGSGFIYQTLTNPVRIETGQYYLVSRESGGGSDDAFYGHVSTVAQIPQLTNNDSSVIDILGAGSYASGTWTAIASSSNHCYGPLNLQYE